MKSSGVGKIVVKGEVSMWIGVAGEATNIHSHHAVQISLGLSGEVQFKSDGTEWQSYSGVVIASHHRHAFSGAGTLIAHIFVEPESKWGQILLSQYDASPIHPIPKKTFADVERMLKQAYESATDDQLKQALEGAVERLTQGCLPLQTKDPRIIRSIAQIERAISQPMRLNDVAQAVHLSPSRFRHLFVLETGLSFRTYVLWVRLRKAVELIGGGQPLTSAAHAAGFADSSHLSRTFRRMFGIAPASLNQL